jgi:nucleotide-binding universal stress UspA family protein
MEKILVVIDAHKPQLPPIQAACRLAALTKSHLTGLFVENLFERKEEAALVKDTYFKTTPESGAEAVVTTDTDHAITLFTRECALHSIATDAYVDKGEPIQLVLGESRYADLLVVDPGVNFFEDSDDQLPSHFCKEIMARAECPVFLSPQVVTDVEEVIFCYDGSASAVFAMKQFTYLFPEYKNTKALMLSVRKSKEQNPTEDDERMMTWLRSHYETVAYNQLTGSATDELFTYLFRKEKKLVVMGSYGRSALSNFFKRSAADTLIRTVDLPLFITHFNR